MNQAQIPSACRGRWKICPPKRKMQSKTQQSACLGNICKECYNDKEPDKEEN